MNILNKIQQQMEDVKTLEDVVRDIMSDSEFFVTFHVYGTPSVISVSKTGGVAATLIALWMVIS